MELSSGGKKVRRYSDLSADLDEWYCECQVGFLCSSRTSGESVLIGKSSVCGIRWLRLLGYFPPFDDHER